MSLRPLDVTAPDATAFAAVHARGEAQLVWTRLVDDLETPVSAFLKLGAGRRYAGLFESVEGGAWRGRYSVIVRDPDLVWRARGEAAECARGADAVAGDAFAPEPGAPADTLRRLVAEAALAPPPGLPPMAAGLFGVLGYDAVRWLESTLGAPNPDPLALPDAVMMRPRLVAIFDSVHGEIVLSTPARPQAGETADVAYAAARARLAQARAELAAPLLQPPPPAQPSAAPELRSPTTREAYKAMVERARRYIEAGDVFQVVPSQRFSGPYAGDPFAFYRALRRLNPSPFLYFLDLGGFQLAGSSPEILVRYRDDRVTIRPIAGTRPRGDTPEADAALERELLADPKERAEHLMLLDLGRNDVARALRLGEDDGADAPQEGPLVRVTESFAVERYSTVMHIVSNVEGRARARLDPVDTILRTLPAGTLSGAPKVRAMQIIDELESVKRGVGYGGAAGYISAAGEVDTCIVLRTALFAEGHAHVQAGGGVVADSDPDAEYEETLHKSRALMRAAAEAWRFER